jgi:excinuclease UvrABC nuclease subunit
VCSQSPTPLGPLRSRTRARLACRALDGASDAELGEPALALPRLRAKLSDLAECRRYEDAARLRDRIDALEQLVRQLRRLERLRRTSVCVLIPAAEAGFVRALFVDRGCVSTLRTLPPGAGARLEVEAGLAAVRQSSLVEQSYLAADALDPLLLVGTFLRRPPPELRVAPLETHEILKRAAALQGPLTAAARRPEDARAA